MVTTQDITNAIQEGKLADHPICIHSSLGSFGWIDGGATTIIDQFLAHGCTVLVPAGAWSYYAVPPPRHQPLPQRNGWDYEGYVGPTVGIERIYDPTCLEIDHALGALPKAIVTLYDCVRGDHPLFAFAAVGPHAAELIAAQRALDVFAPLRKLAALNGKIVLMGVDLNRMTALHLAEELAGRQLFRRWANGPDNRPTQFAVGGCSEGFHHFDSVLAPIEEQISVGKSRWRLFPAQAALELACQAIQQRPSITHCGRTDCDRCHDAVAGGPLLK